MIDIEIREELSRFLAPVEHQFHFWHYTSVGAAIAILEGRELHLGCHAFMNDPAEGAAAGPLVQRCWEDALDSVSEPTVLDSTQMRDIQHVHSYFNYERRELPPSFLFSLTELEDSLSQWARYGSDGCGLALKFAIYRDALPKRSPRPWTTGGEIVSVRYDSAKKPDGALRNAVTQLLTKYIPRMKSPEQADNVLIELVHYLNPMVKHASYAEEREWRVVTRTVIESSDLYQLKSHRFGIAPFVPYRLGVGVELEEVMLGPKLSRPNEWSVKWLCEKHGVTPEYSRSQLSYR